MAKTEQDIGEARVQVLFIQPLERLGLGRPKGTLVSAFDDMKRELCTRLWRLDEGGLVDLVEWVIQHSQAKANRWPPAALILEAAKPLLPPPWPPSDRMVAMFRHEIGRSAIAKGWAPELFRRYVGTTTFPNDYSAGLVFEQARPALARMVEIERQLAASEPLTGADRLWRDRRLNMIAHCERIRDYRAEVRV